MGSKLFLEGLPPSFSTQQLMDLLAPFGTVLSALVMIDPAGESLRMGKVEMSTPREAERAIQKLHRSHLQGKLLLRIQASRTKVDLPDKRRKEPHRLLEIMEEPKQADHSVTVVIVALTAIVFVLDVMTPTGHRHLGPVCSSAWIHTLVRCGTFGLHRRGSLYRTHHSGLCLLSSRCII